MTRDRLYRLAVCLHLRRPLPPEVMRLRAAMEMRETGVTMYRQRMIRENPDAKPPEIEAMVRAWQLRPEEVPKGFTAYEADCCKHCTRLIILCTGEWVHRDGKITRCAGRQAVAEPIEEHYITEAGR